MMNDLQDLMEELNNMFYTQNQNRGFPVDVTLENNTYKVYAEMPGVNKEDIKLSFENGTLTIVAEAKKDKKEKYLIRERNTPKYKRELYFGDILEDSIQAKYDLGVLEITIKLKEKEKKA